MISYNTKTITTLIFIFLNLSAFKLLPANGGSQEIIVLIVFFLITPFIYSKFILKNKPYLFGLQIGDPKKGLILSLVSLGISLLFIYLLFNYFGFVDKYIIPQGVGKNFQYFVYYELVIVLFLSLVYEVFFRGFLINHLGSSLGRGVIVFQWIIFLILIALNSQFSWSLVPYIIFFPFAGWIAYESRSLLYSLVTQSVFIFIVDIVFIKLSF